MDPVLVPKPKMYVDSVLVPKPKMYVGSILVPKPKMYVGPINTQQWVQSAAEQHTCTIFKMPHTHCVSENQDRALLLFLTQR